MDNLFIEPTDDQPKVEFFHDTGEFIISGKSLPEDVSSFYKPVMEWLQKYSLQPNLVTELTFKLTYFNTASSKVILDMLMIMEKIQDSKKQVTVNWYYPVYDEDMKEAGEEYSEMVDLQFNYISYTP